MASPLRSPLSLGLAALAVLLPGCHKSSTSSATPPLQAHGSIARQWNEHVLHAIRNDFARPTVHARNLYHISCAMWDAWAAFDDDARGVMVDESHTAEDIQAARHEAISYAAYRVMSARFAKSPGTLDIQTRIDAFMDNMGYDRSIAATVGNSPAVLGNRIAATVLAIGFADGANELQNYENRHYQPINPPLFPDYPGNPRIVDPDRWQPLSLRYNIDQAGNPIPVSVVPFLSPEWGECAAFALDPLAASIHRRDGYDYKVYHDPGPPPKFGDLTYNRTFEVVLEWSALLDPADGVMVDISPGARGNNTLGTNDGKGRALNPATGEPYAPQLVPAGDYYRVLAEFWADGPDSETPPGHWFVIANYVSDQPGLEKRFMGQGPVLDDLEWDVKLYLTLGGTMHDVAVTAWGIKGWYDYIRPISVLRLLADIGQRSDPNADAYHPLGVELVPGRVELVTADSIKPGERHEHLAGNNNGNIGKIAVRAWRGPDFITDPDVDVAGVGWILLENWWPYQRPSFVTPPFAGYVSGHSTFSRAAATCMHMFTGSEFFPGGMGEFHAPKNEFLVFEDGPSVDLTLQWATYYDAADECSLSRIYGGIHPPADDIPGRLIGADIGPAAFNKARQLFGK